MEVCPPAETCRDAFERMSRATVRMGSKGFASQAVGGGSLTASAKSLASTTKTNRAAPQNVQLAPVQRSQRPTRRPTFDMDLSDLYQSPPSQPAQLNTPPRQRAYQPTQSLTTPSEQYQSHPQYPQAYGGYDQTAQQQQQYYMAQSPQSAGSAAPPAFTSPTHSDHQQQSLTDMSLDFLDFATNPTNNMNQDADMSNPDSGNAPSLNQFAGPFNLSELQGTGINLGGFGMDADYLRDLTTDGSGYDLMDGYWFGMSGGGNSGI